MPEEKRCLFPIFINCLFTKNLQFDNFPKSCGLRKRKILQLENSDFTLFSSCFLVKKNS